MAKKLTLKRKRFVKAYIENNGNATQAVIDAGYKAGSRQLASQIGSALVKVDAVQHALADIIKGNALDDDISSILTQILRVDVTLLDKRELLEHRKLQLQAIAMISKFKGLDAPKRIDKRVLALDATSLLPKGEFVTPNKKLNENK